MVQVSRGLGLLWVGVFLAGCSGEISGDFGGPADRARLREGRAGQGSDPADEDSMGEAGDGSDPTDGNPTELDTTGVDACDARVLPQQPLRRLSSTQYRNTLTYLFGDQLAAPFVAGSLFPETVIQTGFSNDAEANLVNTQESNAIEDNAERIASQVLPNIDGYAMGLLPCELKPGWQDAELDACVPDFISEFGLRAYRRPLTDAERAIAQGLYDGLRDSDQSAGEGFAALLQFFVQSPALLYRVERGAGVSASGLQKLSDYEMATRLSYFFLDSMPDDELFSAAEEGRLSTPAQVATEARRLMASPRFLPVLESFHRDWLRLYELERADKDAELFPAYSPSVRDSLLQEVSQQVRAVLEDQDGAVSTLLAGTTTHVNSVLAEFYGVSAPGADAQTWVPVELPHRRGVLTLASVMATLAKTDRTNPIHRGAFIQREILCNRLPAFPANLDTQTALLDTSMLPTARERLSPLLQTSPCMGCHVQFNPTGLAFENYDAVGQWRDEENGAAIDASSEVTIDRELQSFATPLELVEAFADSQQVLDCYALQWYRDALGRREFEEDACSLALAQRAVADSGGDLKELLVAITQTDGFMYRQPTDAEEAP